MPIFMAWSKPGDYMLRLMRALIGAWRIEPALNAWYDAASNARALFDHIDLAIAVDTPQGLIVPVVRHIENKPPEELKAAVAAQKNAAHQRSIPPEDLRDFTLMLSNFGTLAGRYGIPIVVPPAVAILGAGKVRTDAVAVGGTVAAHRRMPLSLSFDHRCITGGEACRFLAAVIADLENRTDFLRTKNMHQASTEQYRKSRRPSTAAAARLPKSRRGADYKRFLDDLLRQRRCRGHGGARPGGSRGRGAVASQVRAARAAAARWCGCSIRPCAKHGYTSPHTVIEMVNDDMPFLVDSIGLALTAAIADHAFPGASRSSPYRAIRPESLRSLEETRSGRRQAAVVSSRSSMPRWTASSTPACSNRCARTSSAACATCASPAPIGPRCAPRRAGRPMI